MLTAFSSIANPQKPFNDEYAAGQEPKLSNRKLSALQYNVRAI